MIGRQVILAVIIAALLGAGLFAYYEFSMPPSGCSAPNAPMAGRYQAQTIRFGAVTEYCLDGPSRWSNGIFVAPDGSVWFGEQAVPGLGHLFTNGTVVEYPWPGYQGGGSVSSSPTSSIWGVVAWNGRIWAADGDANRLFGFDPADRSTISVNATGAPFPYLLTPAPDGSLWFTTLSTRPLLANLGIDLSLTVYPVSGIGKEEPIQVLFENSTLAYMVALNPDSTTGEGGLYSFNPETSTGTIAASRVGGNFSLYFPDGLSQAGDEIWVTQHYPSNLVGYDLKSGAWTVYPTSLVSYSYTTLPYFVVATSSGVWFNEHYGNKIAFLDQRSGKMTEYSEANPSITNGTQIQNDLTIALGQNGLWFTSTSANYLGFINGVSTPAFTIQATKSNTLSISQGGSATIHFQLGGTWGNPLRVLASDSENITSVPKLISIQPGTSSFPAGSGPASLSVMVSAAQTLPPGRYTIDVTVTDGLVYQTAFVFLTVT